MQATERPGKGRAGWLHSGRPMPLSMLSRSSRTTLSTIAGLDEDGQPNSGRGY